MFLKNKNIIFKIRRPKVTEYAALRDMYQILMHALILLFFFDLILNFPVNIFLVISGWVFLGFSYVGMGLPWLNQY